MAIYMMREANTYLAHYPLTSSTTTSDTSGNNKNLTKSWTVTFGTYWGVDCAYFNGGYLYINESLALGSDPRTISCWFNRQNATSEAGAFWGMWTASSTNWITTYLHGNAPIQWHYGYGNREYNRDVWFNQIPTVWDWTLLTVTYNWSDLLVYVNSSYLWTPTIWDYAWTNTITLNLTNTATTLAQMPNFGAAAWKGYFSDFIFDWKAWTAQEVLDYYNDTKSNYWL